MDLRIVQNTLRPLPFLLIAASDHVTPLSGRSPSVLLSRNGQPFAPPAGAVSELGAGWYQVAGNATDSALPGPLLLDVAAGTDFDPVSARFEVVPAVGVAPLTVDYTGYPLTFLMISSTDRLSGVPGLSPSVQIAAPGSSFAAPVGVVRELGGAGNGRGWYYVAPAAADNCAPGRRR